MKEINNYIFLVDGHRPITMYRYDGQGLTHIVPRQTAGRYRVGAKSLKEAQKILHEAIKFGSVTFLREDKDKRNAMYKQVIYEYGHGKEIYKSL